MEAHAVGSFFLQLQFHGFDAAQAGSGHPFQAISVYCRGVQAEGGGVGGLDGDGRGGGVAAHAGVFDPQLAVGGAAVAGGQYSSSGMWMSASEVCIW